MQHLLLEKTNLKQGFLGDLTAGASSARISLGQGDRVAFAIYLASHASDLTVTLRQSTAITGGTTKDLVRNSRYFKKVDTATKFTAVDVLATPLAAVTDASANGVVALFVFEVRGEDLDQANDFSFVSIDIGAAARNGSVLLIQSDNRFAPAYELDV